MNKTNNQEYVSRLKKAYSTLSQATNLIIAEEGTPRADKGGWADSTERVYELYKKHLINAKECNYTISDNGNIPACFDQLRNGKSYLWLSGKSTYRPTSSELKSFILADGSQVLIEPNMPDDCSEYCILFRVDVNGAKKPNIVGRDLFDIIVTEKGAYPRGYTTPDHESICNKTVSGFGCATRILREGAMNY